MSAHYEIDKFYASTTDITAGLRRAFPIGYQELGSPWNQGRAMRKLRKAQRQANRIAWRHRIHRLFAAVFGGGG